MRPEQPCNAASSSRRDALARTRRTGRWGERVSRRWFRGWLLLTSLLWFCSPASAHESAPGVLALKEVSEGRYFARWTNPMPPIDDLVVQLPEHCRIAGKSNFGYSDAPVVASEMTCDGQLAGEVTFTSNSAQLGPIGVNVEWQDGAQSLALSQGSPPKVTLGGMSHDSTTPRVLWDYGLLGIEHILGGIDHLLFLLGLLLLARGWKRLLATISAFTVAHSITLAAASLELVDVPSAPVEISIALSVLLLAVEVRLAQNSAQLGFGQSDSIRKTSSAPLNLTLRWPWLVAFGFGLLHGLGFASALSDVGLPRNSIAVALLGFNIGVEIGQVGIVACVFTLFRLSRPTAHFQRRVEWLSVGVLTACSTFWLLQRVEDWLLGFAS